jgi:hypothetical protein
MENSTIHLGHAVIQYHSGTLGWGPTHRPRPWPFGQPMPAGVAQRAHYAVRAPGWRPCRRLHDGENLPLLEGKQGGRSPPVMGGGHSRDLRWPAELWADDRETWGKTIARSRGLARRKESPNGGANQRLAGVERRVVSHLGIGERNGKRMKLRPMSPFYRGRREKEQASVVGDSLPVWWGRTRARREWLPYPHATDGWARNWFQTVPSWCCPLGLTVHRVRPANN